MNTSSSLPNFFWRVRLIGEKEAIHIGDFVVASPSDIADGKNYDNYVQETYFNFGRIEFLKQVSGMSGDVIENDLDVLSADSSGHPLPSYPLPTVLRDGEYWLTSDKERGFDSRYFGPVNRRAIKAKAEPLF